MLDAVYAIISATSASLSPASRAVRSSGLVTSLRLFSSGERLRRRFQGALSCQFQVTHQLPVFRQGASLPHMLRDRDRLLALRQGVRLLQRLGRPQVQELAARSRDGRQQSLPHQPLRKRKARPLTVATVRSAPALSLDVPVTMAPFPVNVISSISGLVPTPMLVQLRFPVRHCAARFFCRPWYLRVRHLTPTDFGCRDHGACG